MLAFLLGLLPGFFSGGLVYENVLADRVIKLNEIAKNYTIANGLQGIYAQSGAEIGVKSGVGMGVVGAYMHQDGITISYYGYSDTIPITHIYYTKPPCTSPEPSTSVKWWPW